MLRQKHRFTKLNRCTRHWQGYRLHMCGLCHALGDGYGQLSRLLTSRELILLNMLVSAQLPELTTSERRCPLNPRMHVQTNISVASKFSAAMAIKLTEASVADDIQDEGGLMPRIAQFALNRPAQRANTTLEALAFTTTGLNQLTRQQTLAEISASNQPEHPSATLSADIFAMTATLTQLPDNAPHLTEIGQAYGATIYWMDAYLDFAQDMQAGAFNPLREYAQQANILALDGLQLLHAKFGEYEKVMRENLAALTLYRYRSDLETLLLEPLARVQTELNELIQQERALRFKPRQTEWRLASLIALVFTVLGLSFTKFEPELTNHADRKRKNHKQPRQGSFLADCCYYSAWGCDVDTCELCCCCDSNDDGSCCEVCSVDGCDCDGSCCEVCSVDGCDCDGGCCECGDCDCGGCDCGGCDCS